MIMVPVYGPANHLVKRIFAGGELYRSRGNEGLSMAFNPIHVIFGLKLRQARLARHLSITELSERSGLSPSYITEIEKGRKYPKAERIMDLARALGYDYDELVSLRLDPPLSRSEERRVGKGE